MPMLKYETDPLKIREKSFKKIRELISLDELPSKEQEVAVQMIQASGDLSIFDKLRFSDALVDHAMQAMDDDYEIICDTESVICGLNQKYLKNEPISLINKANVISQAKSQKKTRSMTAVDFWKPYLAGSIILIGNEPTALFRLLELLDELDPDKPKKKPALIIATPAGFVGATEAKQLLWEKQASLGTPCITLLGTRGSSNLASTAMNVLLKMHAQQEEQPD